MENVLKSEGKCPFCAETVAKRSISQHLEKHLKNTKPIAANPARPCFHLRVEAGNYFLHLLLGANQSLEQLDDFLRQIWLECCGHMSTFEIDGITYSASEGLDDDWGVDTGDFYDEVRNILRVGQTIRYQYDMGSTTELKINVISTSEQALSDVGLRLLSRNEPFPVWCIKCKKNPAETLVINYDDRPDEVFCKSCFEEFEPDEDDETYPFPLVNSPRLGVCAYEGGVIDLERDCFSGGGGSPAI